MEKLLQHHRLPVATCQNFVAALKNCCKIHVCRCVFVNHSMVSGEHKAWAEEDLGRLRRRRLTPRATAALSVPINDFYNRSSLLQNTDATFIPDTTSVLVNPCLTSTTTSTPSSAWGISTTPLSPPVSRAALLSSRNCRRVELHLNAHMPSLIARAGA